MTKWCQICKFESYPGRLKRITAPVFFIIIPLLLSGQRDVKSGLDHPWADTVKNDTGHSSKKPNSSDSFYDSVYHKFQRHTFSRLLYNLAFVPPKIPTLPDTVQNIRSEDPYLKYKGKVIRKIHIRTLEPFGPTVLDTSGQAVTPVGKAADNIHLTTRKYVIRKNLLFKQGQHVDPEILADNERILRDMPAIDDVRFIITPAEGSGDSVDITVVAKDVFSIGFDVVTATPYKSVFRLYDGNFLGLGDRIVNEFSLETNRAPFVQEGGLYYYLTNIGGSFVDGIANYTLDDQGSQNLGFGLQRSFFSNKTRWAGSTLFQYLRDVHVPNDTLKITSYLENANVWIGRAFLLRTKGEPMRFVISEAVYNKNYFSRPFISADSNKRYYNYLQLLTGLSLSRNNYYLTDYVFDLGKKENIPYGYLFQVTFGPEFSDFYNRLYGGIEIAYGDFIRKFGYLSGQVSYSGYFNGNSYEDAILKVQTRYMTYLFYSPDKRYKFRTYLVTDYRSGFNFRLNNTDYSNINQDLQIRKTTDQNSLEGMRSLSANLSTMIYTPWYFYGFKFALLGQIQGGFVAKKNTALFTTPFYPGIRTALVIRNDNLIFPALVFSVFYYPTTPTGGSWLQFSFDVSTGLKFPDYNVTAPKEETLQN
jgi:hypothetical protein